ncbi:MAG: pyruvate kinase [Nitrospira sp.]|nr:pyruvate kinase [Nitrospira sp.]MDH4302436.1 pyruvate kinase [Nitrospira sp.]MDH5192561.1 pyruvate kinase [Nitrospira sp.]
MRKAKIICTIGPASSSPVMVDRLITSGMNAARLNFSHGTYEWHAAAITTIRQAAAKQGSAVAIIQDLQGPRIRVGLVSEAGIHVTAGQTVRLRACRSELEVQPVAPSSSLEIPISYPYLTQDLRAGSRILINDGLIELVADRMKDDVVECSVLIGGTITSHKGINLPGTAVSAPTLTEKDRNDMRFGVEQAVDYIALSFVRGPNDIEAARAVLQQYGRRIPLIAKIERAEAIATLDDILDCTDGVMIARGDLGVEMGPEAVPILQKRIIVEANRRRRLVITATQMLESMTQATRPTRAEASDVANAIFDGSDAVMLSAETAVGAYPVEAVQVMDRLIRAAEDTTEPGVTIKADPSRDNLSLAEAISAAAASAARSVGARAIVAFTESGATARLISKQRPTAPLLAFTPSEPIRQQMALYWGVRPFPMSRGGPPEAWIAEVEQRLTDEGLCSPGNIIAVVSGTMAGQVGGTNMLKLHEIGSLISGGDQSLTTP